MGRRSTQAHRLGRELSAAVGVDVEVRHEVGATWWVEWGGGPTVDQMRDGVAAVLDRFDELQDRTLRYHRGTGAHAWAARAIAARRDGSLAREVAARSHVHRQALSGSRPFGGSSDLTAEDHAVLGYVDELLEQTPYPARVDDPADEPLVEQLLVDGGHNEYQMVRILTNELRAPKPQASGPTLRLLSGCA